MFGECDDRFLMQGDGGPRHVGLRAEAAAQPKVRLAVGPAAVPHRRATEPGRSLHWHVELLRSVILRASVSGRSRWSRAQHQVLRDYITDWELDRVGAREPAAQLRPELDSKPRR